MKWTNGKDKGKGQDPNCPYCQDDGKPCNRCGVGMGADWKADGRSFAQGGQTSNWGLGSFTGGTSSAPPTFEDRRLPPPKHQHTGTMIHNVKPHCDHRAAVSMLHVCSRMKHLYAAQGSKLASAAPEQLAHLGLIIDLAGLVKPKRFVLSGPRKFAVLNQGSGGPDVLRFDWPDMTAPTHVPIRFWQRLLQLIPEHTAIACVGGHGRTGTALAALLIADGMGAEQAIRLVRTKHCDRAIETPGQEAYLRKLEHQRIESDKLSANRKGK